MCLGELPSSKAKELVHYLLSPGSLPHGSFLPVVLLPSAQDPRLCRCPGENPSAKLNSESPLLIDLPWRLGHEGPTPLIASPTLPGGAHKPMKMTAAVQPRSAQSNWPPPGREWPHRALTQLSEPGAKRELKLCVARMSPFSRYLETEAPRKAEIHPRPCRSPIPSSTLSPERTLGPLQ